MSKQEMPTMSDLAKVQNKIFNLPERGELSDGYHSFNELYYHRMILFSIICNQNKAISWKSKQHEDGTMFEKDNLIAKNIDPKNVRIEKIEYRPIKGTAPKVFGIKSKPSKSDQEGEIRITFKSNTNKQLEALFKN